MNMLAKKLKKLRQDNDMSQEYVASKLNVVRQTVSKWEKGECVPDADMIVKIAQLYNISVANLLADEDNNIDLSSELSQINEQLKYKNELMSKIIKTIAIIAIVLVCLSLLPTITNTLKEFGGTLHEWFCTKCG